MTLRKNWLVGGIALALMAAAPSAQAQTQGQLASIISAAISALKQANGGAYDRMSPAQQNSAVRMMVSETVGSMFTGAAADQARQNAEIALDGMGGNLSGATPEAMADAVLNGSSVSGIILDYTSAVGNSYAALPPQDQTAGTAPTIPAAPPTGGGDDFGLVIGDGDDSSSFDNTDWTAGLLDSIAIEITGDIKVNSGASDG